MIALLNGKHGWWSGSHSKSRSRAGEGRVDRQSQGQRWVIHKERKREGWESKHAHIGSRQDWNVRPKPTPEVLWHSICSNGLASLSLLPSLFSKSTERCSVQLRLISYFKYWLRGWSCPAGLTLICIPSSWSCLIVLKFLVP